MGTFPQDYKVSLWMISKVSNILNLILSILFPGDRVLTINNQPINDLHLSSVNQLIEKTKEDVLLEVQYQAEIGCKN